jgi:hypothetical protein
MDHVDDSCGSAQALRNVWKNHGQQKTVAHISTTLLCLSTTGLIGSITIFEKKGKTSKAEQRQITAGLDRRLKSGLHHSLECNLTKIVSR